MQLGAICHAASYCYARLGMLSNVQSRAPHDHLLCFQDSQGALGTNLVDELA